MAKEVLTGSHNERGYEISPCSPSKVLYFGGLKTASSTILYDLQNPNTFKAVLKQHWQCLVRVLCKVLHKCTKFSSL